MRTVRILTVVVVCLLAALGAAQEAYEVAAGDVLHVTVVGQPQMSGDFTVDLGGTIVLPVVGKVVAAGLTTGSLERKIVTLLSDGYLKRPEVIVTLKESRNQRVFVTGEVGRPGPYPLRGDGTLLGLLPDIGALGGNAGHEVVVIRPPTGEVPELPAAEAAAPVGRLPNEVPGAEILRISLKELLSGNPAKNLALKAGDTIYFPPAASYYITGHAARPGTYKYQEGLTVFQALTQAGGVADRGSSKVKIIRVVNGKPVEVKAKMTDVIQPEDTIKVPEKFF